MPRKEVEGRLGRDRHRDLVGPPLQQQRSCSAGGKMGVSQPSVKSSMILQKDSWEPILTA